MTTETIHSQLLSAATRLGTSARSAVASFREGPALRTVVFAGSCIAGWMLASWLNSSVHHVPAFLGGFQDRLGDAAHHATNIGGALFR